jgi:signal transduction histidine kinase
VTATDEQRADPVVLLVDDDETARLLHRQALEPAGFEIVEAAHGLAALEAFAVTMPDIVVLDVVMPQMDGFAVCQAIRTMPAGRSIPILMATGLDDLESIERAYLVGATDFIAKPISCPVLPHRLRYMLRGCRLAETQRMAGLGDFRWLPKNRCIECSPELSQMFGVCGSIAAHPVRDLLRRVLPPDRAALIQAVRGALRGATIELDHRIVTPQGEVRSLSLRGEMIGAEGSPRYLRGSYLDITERKRIEGELEAARDEARTANASKTAFLASLSHELRTPLNAIIGFSELIAREALGTIPQRRYIEFADNIRSAGQRALAVFLDILTMAELEAGRFSLNLEQLDLREVADTSVAEFQRSDAAADHQIDLVSDGARSTVHADRQAVDKMLRNLLSNAAKFSAAGSVIQVTVGVSTPGFCRVSVADDGIGMTAEEAQSAVRPFGQVGNGLTRPYGGLGLGLSIVRKLIERHGGRLTIASAPLKGTQISLDFPTTSLVQRDTPPANGESREEAAGCADLDAFLTDLRIAQAATNEWEGATHAEGTLSRARLKKVERTRGFQ